MSDHHSNQKEVHGTCGCDHNHESPWPNRSLAIAAILNLTSLCLQWTGMAGNEAITGIAISSVVLGGWFLVPGAWEALRKLRPNISLLMVVATIGAGLIGEWLEAATVVVLFGVAEWLESWADRRARRAVRALLELAPETAMVKTEEGMVEIPVENVQMRSLVFVKNGERIPLDGIIRNGRSAINQAPITGESVPVDKQIGDQVFAGSINGEGAIEFEVNREASNTTLARIIKLVEDAQEQKAPTQRFVDKFARYYTPSVAFAALLLFGVPVLFFGGEPMQWLYRSCVLLIIACPCALVISTPVSIVAGLTALAKQGVLVKGGAHLESLGQLRAIAMDKTGTITEGRPRVVAIYAVGATAEETIRVAAAIDDNSSHPLAIAVIEEASKRKIVFHKAENFTAILGRGAQASIDSKPVFIGNHRLVHELGLCTNELEAQLEQIEKQGLSAIIVGEKTTEGLPGRILGILAVGDSIRAVARTAVAALHAANVKPIVMLSGDNQCTVDAIAKEAGIDIAQGDLLPEDKVAAVMKLRQTFGVVAMVGDGVNDAPAMATASLGIAMGTAGTDAAIETADITLMRDDLMMIARGVHLGRRTLRIIYFNITFSLTLKAVFLVLAIIGYTSLWMAIMADTGATLMVVANSLRLLRGSAQHVHADQPHRA